LENRIASQYERDRSPKPFRDHGYTVNDDEDDPVLLDEDGDHVDTWRERYPYDHRMPRDEYERVKRWLQIELLKLQKDRKRNGARLVIVLKVATPPAREAPFNASSST
jgi:polyphosphate kinase 2 (PPK2 family)